MNDVWCWAGSSKTIKCAVELRRTASAIQKELAAEPQFICIKVSQWRWFKHLIRMRSRRLPLEVFQEQVKLRRDPRQHTEGDYMSHLAGNLLKSLGSSWRRRTPGLQICVGHSIENIFKSSTEITETMFPLLWLTHNPANSFKWNCFVTEKWSSWKHLTTCSVDYSEQQGHCFWKNLLLSITNKIW